MSVREIKGTAGSTEGDSEKAYDGHVESTEIIERPGFGQKSKRHCARWWWVHLIVFCATFLIISLCLVYVAMPHIAQHGVNESSIEFTDIEFLDPSPDTVTLTQKAILHSPSMYTPTLDPFNASLFLVTNGTFAAAPMTIITMPKIHALHPRSNASVIEQQVPITNLDQITDYATQVLSQENVTTALVGRTRLHEGHLPVLNIKYNSTTTYKGLNGLLGFNVTGAKINLTAAAGDPNLSGFAYIPNPSVLTVVMGNVTLSLETETAGTVTNIGTATIPNLTIAPGNNTLPMYAVVNQTLVIESMDKSGFVEMIITGTSSVYNGQHLTYYEKALSSNVLRLSMNVAQILADSV